MYFIDTLLADCRCFFVNLFITQFQNFVLIFVSIEILNLFVLVFMLTLGPILFPMVAINIYYCIIVTFGMEYLKVIQSTNLISLLLVVTPVQLHSLYTLN